MCCGNWSNMWIRLHMVIRRTSKTSYDGLVPKPLKLAVRTGDAGSGRIKLNLCYSFRRLSTGFAKAALMACELTVSNAISIASNPATANIHHCISIR